MSKAYWLNSPIPFVDATRCSQVNQLRAWRFVGRSATVSPFEPTLSPCVRKCEQKVWNEHSVWEKNYYSLSTIQRQNTSKNLNKIQLYLIILLEPQLAWGGHLSRMSYDPPVTATFNKLRRNDFSWRNGERAFEWMKTVKMWMGMDRKERKVWKSVHIHASEWSTCNTRLLSVVLIYCFQTSKERRKIGKNWSCALIASGSLDFSFKLSPLTGINE